MVSAMPNVNMPFAALAALVASSAFAPSAASAAGPERSVGPNGSSMTGFSFQGKSLGFASETLVLANGDLVDADASAFNPYESPSLTDATSWVLGLGPNGSSFLGGSELGFGFSGADLRAGLIYAELDDGSPIEIRIDGMRMMPGFHLGFQLEARTVGGQYEPICGGDTAYLVPGLWDDHHLGSGGGLSIACRGSSVAKCAEYGYRPWSRRSGMRALHKACVRMLRADYCGDGRSFTVDGTLIGHADRMGMHSVPSTWELEATWSPAGATCIERTRIDGAGASEACVQARMRSRCSPRAGILRSAIVGATP